MRGMWDAITSVMTSWHEGKLFIEHMILINHDALHVIVGVLLWVVFGLVIRRPLSSWYPWLWLFALILWSETVDLWVEQWPDPGQQYGEGAKDVILTVFLPAVLMFVVRFRPGLFAAGAKRRAKRRW